MRVYVASSWRNEYQPNVIRFLRDRGHEVYDFRNPRPDDNGFQWSEIDPDWLNWTPERYIEALEHPLARDGFHSDIDALNRAEATMLVLPCGRSAHLELGYAVGRGQKTAILLRPDGFEPELMYSMVGMVSPNIFEIAGFLERREATKEAATQPHEAAVRDVAPAAQERSDPEADNRERRQAASSSPVAELLRPTEAAAQAMKDLGVVSNVAGEGDGSARGSTPPPAASLLDRVIVAMEVGDSVRLADVLPDIYAWRETTKGGRHPTDLMRDLIGRLWRAEERTEPPPEPAGALRASSSAAPVGGGSSPGLLAQWRAYIGAKYETSGRLHPEADWLMMGSDALRTLDDFQRRAYSTLETAGDDPSAIDLVIELLGSSGRKP